MGVGGGLDRENIGQGWAWWLSGKVEIEGGNFIILVGAIKKWRGLVADVGWLEW